MIKIRLLVIAIFSIASLDLRAEPIGSMRNAMGALKGSDRLEYVENTYRELWMGRDTNLQREVLDLYVEMADAQKSYTIGAFARMLQIDLYRNNNMSDSMSLSLGRNLQFMRNYDLWKYYYLSWAIGIQHQLGQGKVGRALHETQKMHADASRRQSNYGLNISGCLIGFICHYTGREELAESYLRLSMADLSQEDEVSMFLYADLILAQILQKQGKFQQQLAHCELWQSKLDRHRERCSSMGKKTNLNSHYLYCYSSYALALIKTGHIDRASRYVALVKECAVGKNDRVRSGMFYVLSLYNAALGNHSEALSLSDSALSIVRSRGDHYTLFSVLESKAEMMVAMDRSDEAVNLYRELLYLKDSLLNLDYANLTNALNDKYVARDLIIKKRSDTGYLITIITICLLLLAVLLFCYLYLKRIRGQNKILGRVSPELPISLEQSAASTIDHKAKQADGPTKIWMEDLFSKLENLMYNEKLYTDPNLSRKLLAEKLRTNIVYLSDTIRYFTHGMTIGEYITDIRLKVAADLLINHKEMNINDIVYACGYSSRTTMFRQFRERYAMSPSEYRASAN